MHTGRGDAELRARTRKRIPVEADASDAACGFCIGSDFERFSQVDDVFSRSRFDPAVHSEKADAFYATCLLYTSPSPRDKRQSRMPSSA